MRREHRASGLGIHPSTRLFHCYHAAIITRSAGSLMAATTTTTPTPRGRPYGQVSGPRRGPARGCSRRDAARPPLWTGQPLCVGVCRLTAAPGAVVWSESAISTADEGNQGAAVSDLPPPPPDDSGWSSQPPPPRPESSGYGAAPAAGLAALGTGETVELATPGLRLGARLIDIVIGFVIGIIVGLVDPLLLPILAGAAYEVCFVALKGQTPGTMATSIKVVRADNGAFPGWGAAAGRWIIPGVGYILLIIPGLLVHASLLWDDRRQGWHDKAVKTLVVKA
ncbi:MAG: RDD family protein [Acidimicrobiaceae bacterium]|nr:RDD family protein [Acidimicrobiaceae bacterium]MYE95895.1 RDD family protein [Acidimicrobiaceae bacterium]MYI55155.1 RDD family protein [Acidimicrobiaceae bacterium]